MSKAPTYAELVEQSREAQRALDTMRRQLDQAVLRAQLVEPMQRTKPITLPRDMNDDYHRQFGMARPAPAGPVGALDARAVSRQRRRVLARGSRPSAGLEALYRQKLETKVGEMNASVLYWLRSAYRNNPPEMARDAQVPELGWSAHIPDGEHGRDHAGLETGYGVHRGGNPDGGNLAGGLLGDQRIALDRSPASILKAAFDKLAKRWLRQFDELADDLGKWFGQSAAERSDSALRQILRRGGMAVPFQMTPEMRDVLHATVNENVSLIRSIPQNYLLQVEQSVMRSVSEGRDLDSLTRELRDHYGVTKRRAKFIALDQNNKATAAFTRVRQVQHGLKATWVHSSAGKTYRPSHVANSGKEYDPSLGWPDPSLGGKRIWPGTEPNCRCFSRSIIKGFE